MRRLTVRRVKWWAGALACLLGLGVSSAQAALVINARLEDGTTTKVLTSADVGTLIPINIWASVTNEGGNNGTGTREGFHFAAFSMISERSGPGSIAGDLVDPLLAFPFDATGSQFGNLADLNADGVGDLGSSALASTADVARPRAASAIFDNNNFVTKQAIPNGTEWLVETVMFRVDSLGGALSIKPVIPGWVAGAVKGANWWQDSTGVTTNGLNNGEYSAGTAVTFVPEPGSLVLLGLGLVGLAAFTRRRR